MKLVKEKNVVISNLEKKNVKLDETFKEIDVIIIDYEVKLKHKDKIECCLEGFCRSLNHPKENRSEKLDEILAVVR